jgi:hypothetical protein
VGGGARGRKYAGGSVAEAGREKGPDITRQHGTPKETLVQGEKRDNFKWQRLDAIGACSGSGCDCACGCCGVHRTMSQDPNCCHDNPSEASGEGVR